MPKAVDVEERRSELAAAAARVIARSGLGAATMREVSAEAGWTTGALTHYFVDKRDLLQFTLEASLERRRDRRPQRRELNPPDALRAALVLALPIDDDATLHWKVTIAFCAQAAGDPELALVQRDAYRDFRANVAELVERAGRAAGPSAFAEAERLIALLDGVAMQALFDPESWSPERQIGMIDAELVRREACPHGDHR
jgi:AcrR family transcriptional regulator